MRDVRVNKNFLYTQSSLGVFLECPLRFRYKYFEDLYWPEEYHLKEKFQRGREFHLLAERYFKGIDIEGKYLEEGYLKDRFERLRSEFPVEGECRYLSEYEIRQERDGIRLMARYDLIIVTPDNGIQIVDFKTGEKRLDLKKMENSLQTKIYLYLMWENFKLILRNNKGVKNLEMIYYQTEFPEERVVIKYSEDIHENNREFVEGLLDKIENYDFYSGENCRGFYCDKCGFKKNVLKSKKKC